VLSSGLSISAELKCECVSSAQKPELNRLVFAQGRESGNVCSVCSGRTERDTRRRVGIVLQ